jgi:ribbon-helix-helix CopG family protein
MAKTRMQILIDPEAKKMLEREAKSRNISVGQVIREAVELYEKESLSGEKDFTDEDPLWDIVGIATGDEVDVSEEHDHYLYGAAKQKSQKK